MGIEPTQDGTSALLTVLKTAEPTRTLPPPVGRHFLAKTSTKYTPWRSLSQFPCVRPFARVSRDAAAEMPLTRQALGCTSSNSRVADPAEEDAHTRANRLHTPF
jgi:hypothetical protein